MGQQLHTGCIPLNRLFNCLIHSYVNIFAYLLSRMQYLLLCRRTFPFELHETYFSDRANAGVIYETCQSSDGPVIFTGHSRNIWIDFVANKNSSGRGFQMSFLTIEGTYEYVSIFKSTLDDVIWNESSTKVSMYSYKLL